MADSKQNRGSPDNQRIDVHDADELRNWSKSLGVPAEKVKEAVAKVGTSADAVRQYLKGK
jgi:hypothetical protein